MAMLMFRSNRLNFSIFGKVGAELKCKHGGKDWKRGDATEKEREREREVEGEREREEEREREVEGEREREREGEREGGAVERDTCNRVGESIEI